MSLAQELQRKTIHLATSLVPLTYAVWGEKWVAAAILAVLSAGMLALEALRHGEHWFGRTFRRVFVPMLREKEVLNQAMLEAGEKPHWLGATPYCIASLGCILVFPKPIAVLALLYLSFGDTAASLVGKRWGRTRIGSKSLEGSLAFFAATASTAAVAHALSPDYPLGAGIAAGMVAALAELFIHRIDDNYSIPISAGITMWLIGMFAG